MPALIPREIPATAINLLGFSLLEAPTGQQLFQPNWFNVWEAYLHQRAVKRSGRSRWLFKRFGIDRTEASRDQLRRAHYRQWLNGLSLACKQAFQQNVPTAPARSHHQKTALIYFDCWGETALFEQSNSWRDTFSIDMLPKTLVRDYQITDFSCKLRGERNGLLLGLRLAMDRLNSGGVDTVLLCGQFRAIPVLVLSEAGLGLPAAGTASRVKNHSQICVERLGCLLLKKAPNQGMALNLSHYCQLADCQNPFAINTAARQLAENWQGYLGSNTSRLYSVSPPSPRFEAIHQHAFNALNTRLKKQQKNALAAREMTHYPLCEEYGDSGCLNPALALQHLFHPNCDHTCDADPACDYRGADSASALPPAAARTATADTHQDDKKNAHHNNHSLISSLDSQGGAWLLECWQYRGSDQ